ncbi:transposase [Streptomyces sp. NBC_01340]|uniref:transposase n=1 Tax=unclassified Streptomyces TaxID=2593676 RepID=UPI00225BB16C|nr:MULTISPECIES: transposase [unclassified Streptomyces]MCX4457196.1 transposase [Streptomyces sp. NBC_01719]MCX4496554.1 transposase [Streptomyces sp. NBC_01728]WSI41455.1 transposase [Streptomyces sp. NBC_01340]
MEQRPLLRLVECREDIGESGSTYSRPGFDALLDDISAGHVKLVLVHRLDRLGRTEAAIWCCVWQVEDAGGQVECCTESLGEPGIERWLTIDRLAQAVETDYRRILTRTQAGRQLKAVDGGWPGGPAPYGYRISVKGAFGSTLEVDPAEARVVRLVVDLVIGGVRGLTELANELNKRGALTRSGRCWTPANLVHRLKSGTFHGEVVFRRLDRQWGDHCTRLSSDGRPLHGDSVVIPLPSILTTDRLRAFQEALTKLARPRRNFNGQYPLTGRIQGQCGLPYVGCFRSKDGVRTYRCSGWQHAVPCGCVFLPADYVEDEVAKHVSALLRSKTPGSQLTLPSSRDRSPMLIRHGERVTSLERLVAENQDELDELQCLSEQSRVIKAAVRQLESDLTVLRRILTHARHWLGELEHPSDPDARLRAALASATPDIRTLSPSEQRRAVELAEVRVEIVDPTFRYREGTKCLTIEWHQRTGKLVPPDPTDSQWQRVEQLLRSRYPAHHFRSPLNLRAAFMGMLHRLRTGIHWPDLPDRFGEFAKVRPRQRTWLADGVWADIIELLDEEGQGTPVVGYDAVPALAIRTGLDPERVG